MREMIKDLLAVDKMFTLIGKFCTTPKQTDEYTYKKRSDFLSAMKYTLTLYIMAFALKKLPEFIYVLFYSRVQVLKVCKTPGLVLQSVLRQ